MKLKPMLKYCISLFLVFTSVTTFAQEQQDTTQVKTKLKYGLRLGFDLYNPLQTAITPEKDL